jgi:stage III sporulation protein AD
MDLFSIIGIALVGTALCILFKQYKPEYAMLISLGCGVLLFLLVLSQLEPVFDVLQNFMNRVNMSEDYTKVILKALGICYVVQLASDTCKDAGQTAMAGKVELCGKVAVVIISLPLFENLLEIALGLMEP